MAGLDALESEDADRLRRARAALDPDNPAVDELSGASGGAAGLGMTCIPTLVVSSPGTRAVDEHLVDGLGRELGRAHAAPGVDVGLDDARRPLRSPGSASWRSLPAGSRATSARPRPSTGPGCPASSAGEPSLLPAHAPTTSAYSPACSSGLGRRRDVAERDEVLGVVVGAGLERRRSAAARSLQRELAPDRVLLRVGVAGQDVGHDVGRLRADDGVLAGVGTYGGTRSSPAGVVTSRMCV